MLRVHASDYERIIPALISTIAGRTIYSLVPASAEEQIDQWSK
jgi:hypothetical protein